MDTSSWCAGQRTSYSGLDPMEDTETAVEDAIKYCLGRVTVGSIRWRILKPSRFPSRCTTPVAVTVGSIRWRILKEILRQWLAAIALGYSGLDPMEDTESQILAVISLILSTVTVGSIRWRILKATSCAGRRQAALPSYSGLDPMEDTETCGCSCCSGRDQGLQWARSDGGY